MLHTRVRCRARVWDVLDVRHAADVTTWHLLRDHDAPRLIASPPDHVEPMHARVKTMTRRAWVRHVITWVREAAPTWWPARAERLPVATVSWQLVPAMLVLSGHHRRLLLADEVGMGKTVQAALLLHEVHARDVTAATLVIAPAGLLAQWQQELLEKVRLDAAILDADALRREAARPLRETDASRVGSCWLVSLDMLRQPDVVSLLARTPWTLLVVDEAHMASPGSARLTAVQRVADASARVLLMTATPTAAGQHGAAALRAVGRRTAERPMTVLRRPATWMQRAPRRTRVLRVRLDQPHAALCARLDRFVARAGRESGPTGLLPALVLRRRACSCPAALVRSLERRLDVLGTAGGTAPDRLAGLFDAIRDQDDEDAEVMHVPAWEDQRSERAELRALLADATRIDGRGRKLAAITRYLQRVREPVIVFTSYLDTLRVLRGASHHRRVVFVHGGQPDGLRAHALAAFTRGDADILLTTDAAAEGLNLHAQCRIVVHAEVPPSARVLEQRTGRVDRFGQTRRVHTVVMASDAEEDQSALSRLRRRADEDKAWQGSNRARCRRTDLAAHHLAVRRARPRPGPGEEDKRASARESAVARCEMAPSRWQRLVARWHLPPGTRALWVGAIVVAGDAPLSSSLLHVALALRDHEPPHSLETMRLLLPARVARATRLARRMHAWSCRAESGANRERSRDGSDLFDAGQAPALLESRHAGLWSHVRACGLIGQAAPVMEAEGTRPLLPVGSGS